MKKQINVTLQDVTENDIRQAFFEAIDALGIAAGQQIPADMYNLREKVINILFSGESVRPVVRGTKPKLTEEQTLDYFKSGV